MPSEVPPPAPDRKAPGLIFCHPLTPLLEELP